MRPLVLPIAVFLASCARPHARRVHVPPEGDRQARIFVPSEAAPEAGWPLVIILHGARSHARRAEKVTKWTALAHKHGAVAVYPEGIDRSWNDGRSDKVPAASKGIDDIAWLGTVLAQVQASTPIDPDRILLTGASNGAMLGWRWICEGRGTITAFAPVISGLPAKLAPDCQPKPVSALVIHGDADPLVPYAGGVVGRDRGEVVSTEAALKVLRQANGCNDSDAVTRSWDTVTTDTTSASHTRWNSGCEATPVEHIRLHGAGHLWPGAGQAAPAKRVGRASSDVDGAEAAWQFAQRVWSSNPSPSRTPPDARAP